MRADESDRKQTRTNESDRKQAQKTPLSQCDNGVEHRKPGLCTMN